MTSLEVAYEDLVEHTWSCDEKMSAGLDFLESVFPKPATFLVPEEIARLMSEGFRMFKKGEDDLIGILKSRGLDECIGWWTSETPFVDKKKVMLPADDGKSYEWEVTADAYFYGEKPDERPVFILEKDGMVVIARCQEYYVDEDDDPIEDAALWEWRIYSKDGAHVSHGSIDEMLGSVENCEEVYRLAPKVMK